MSLDHVKFYVKWQNYKAVCSAGFYWWLIWKKKFAAMYGWDRTIEEMSLTNKKLRYIENEENIEAWRTEKTMEEIEW